MLQQTTEQDETREMRLRRSQRKHKALMDMIQGAKFLGSDGNYWIYLVPVDAVEQARVIGLTVRR